MKAVFLRALEESSDKAGVLRNAVNAPARACGRTRFEVETSAFGQLPRSPFAYWASNRVRSLFVELPAIESDGRTAKQGLATADDFRFVRMWTEIDSKQTGPGWYPFAKGGKFSPFYADVVLVVRWSNSGTEMKAWANSLYGGSHWSRILKNVDYFFRPGLTWPLRTQSGLALRAMPANCIFSHKGPAAFVANDDCHDLLVLLAIGNSRAFCALVDLQMAFGSFEVGVLQRTPVPAADSRSANSLSALSRTAWSRKRALDSCNESSRAFYLPALLQVGGDSLDCMVSNWNDYVAQVEVELSTIHKEIDDICFGLYGIDDADRQQIEQGCAGDADDFEYKDDDGVEVAEAADLGAAPLGASLIAWAVGVSFGRFDLYLATGERAVSLEPGPFDPLPVCSLGMLTGDDGLPVNTAPPGYPIDFPCNGILVDDAGALHDLVAACRQVFDLIFDDSAARWDEVCDVLDDRATGLRTWLAKQYFEQHIKQYSKSRRKAPIYWQLATPSASYSIWLYFHHFTRDTLFRVLNHHLIPKLKHEERKLTDMKGDGGPSLTSAQRKAIDAQETLVGELRAMRDELARVAPLWNPNLDDGVILNFAPLWRLVPHHSSWQKECKSAWEQLCKGEYDWAHLAMHLWPERVVPKCARDRSLAIAHGLEDMFWRERADGKWQATTTSDAVGQELIQERTIPAVKAALNDLLSAPTAMAGRQRRKKS